MLAEVNNDNNYRLEFVMELNESVEMYLETIYLLERNHGHAHGVDIAKALGVTKASVSKSMNQMKDLGLISKEDYGVITLTKKGLSISKKIYMNHRLISKYLEHSLALPSGEAEENACKMEHVLSTQMLDAIKGYLKNHNITVIVD